MNKSAIVIAGLRQGFGKGSVDVDMIKRSLQKKTHEDYFQLCADLLYEVGLFEDAFHYCVWYHNDLDRLLDCLEKVQPVQDDLQHICMTLAEDSGIADANKLHYSYTDSDYDENPYDPTHWTVGVTNYEYAFEIVKAAASKGNELCRRFLTLIPLDFESNIRNSEVNCY